MQIIGPTSGKHSIKLVVNEDQSIPEKDYTNNSLSRSFTWVSQSQVVDFVADSLERDSSTEIITGTPTNFTLGVANAGGTTSTVVVGVAVNGTLAGAFETAQIGPNQGRYYTFEIQFKTPGKADIDLVVDPHDYIKEWNEVNNIVGDTFVVNPSTDPAVVYGSLGFSYPLPSIYTQIYADYEKHGGLDIAAPEGTEIYSVYDGYVALAGAKPANGNPWDSRGYYVVVVNDVKDPFNGNNIISQYYHMCQRPEVVTGANVSQHELLGYVGLTGSFVGDDPVNHLHIEFNNLNYIGHGVGPEERIEPKYFWPHIKFTYLNSEANTQKLPENFYQDVFEGGNYFDSNLILLVGVDVYEEWVSSHPDPNVYQFISDMGITKEELKDFLTKYVYEEYMKNWPSTVEE